MNNMLTMNTYNNEYEIIIRDSFNNLQKELQPIINTSRDICIISDKNVSSYYLDSIISQLQNNANKIISYIIEPGEQSKNLSTIYEIYELLINEKFDRKSLLIALGGGVVGDLTGFCAATYLRGIDFIQIPTSLLALVDSSIGGKTGVDFNGYKNMIGAFYQPTSVYMNIATLITLPKNEFAAGMAEVIKHALINDVELLTFLKKNSKKIMQNDMKTIKKMIYRSCLIKKNVVEKDEKENNLRAILNFGHTIGHAIEKVKNFEWLHGECVAIGMVASAYISYRRNRITADDLNLIEQVLSNYELPIRITNVSPTQILEATKSDKKVRLNVLHFILLKSLGEVGIYTDISDEELLEAIHYIIE